MTTKITLSNITDSVAANLVQVQTLAAVTTNLKVLANVSSNLLAIGQANAASGGGGTSYGQVAQDNSWFGLPVGNTEQRSNASNGALRLNTETEYMEVFFANNWVNLFYLGNTIASGGTVTTSGDYKIHTFTSSGTFTIEKSLPNEQIEYVAVGGGGGASGGVSYVNYGAGGAGGVLRSNVFQAPGGSNVSYLITVGAGGARGGGNGVSSTIFGITEATGGNGAPSPSRIGASNADFSGGSNFGSYGAGGGAGAGGNGGVPPGTNNGGIGAVVPWMPSDYGTTGPAPGRYFGGGGGGGNSPAGTGGAGGGGAFGKIPGTVNTGGGGGGGDASPPATALGGSGIVVIRYRYQ